MTFAAAPFRRPVPGLLCAMALALVLAASGCATGHPRALSAAELVTVRTFPFFKLYWAGRVFAGHPVTAVDGLRGYNNSSGDTIQYGDCAPGSGLLHTGSCRPDLEIVTVIYRLHCNRSLGRQRNILIRGVPATVFDGGRSIEVYTGRVAVDVYADTPAHALAAAQALRPVNAPGSVRGPLPPPAYHPGLIDPAPSYPVAATVARLDAEGVFPPPPCS